MVSPPRQASTETLVFERKQAAALPRTERYQRFFPGATNTDAPLHQGQRAANQMPPDEAMAPETSQPSGPSEEEQQQALLEQAFEKAAHEGFAAGLAQAQEQTQARIDEHMKQMEQMLHEIIDLRRTTFEEYQEQCLELALAGAEALSRQTLRHHEKALRELLAEAMDELPGQDTILLQVGQDNVQELQAWVNERFPQRSVQVIEDPEMSAQDFRASTKTGSVTGDFQERLARLRQMVFEHRGQIDAHPHSDSQAGEA